MRKIYAYKNDKDCPVRCFFEKADVKVLNKFQITQDYTRLTSAYEKDIEKLTSQFDNLTNVYEKEKTLKSKDNPCLKAFRELKRAKKLTKEMVDTLIDKIYVHGQYEIEIVFNFRDEYEYLMRAIKEAK